MFIDYFSNIENIHSKDINILIGANGSGKSETLNILAKQYLESNYNIIGISNCTFDKFDIKHKNFNFIGMRNGSKIIESTINNFLRKIYHDEIKLEFIEYCFHEIKLKPMLGFEIIDYDELNNLNFLDREKLHKLIKDLYTNKNWDFPISKEVPKTLENFFWFDFREKNIHTFKKTYDLYKIITKITSNNIYVFEDRFILPYPLYKASSGQIHKLLNMLFILAQYDINKKNIIIIDEPETSLHPHWQARYVEDLKIFISKLNSFFNYPYSFKLIVATHSPLIINYIKSKENLRNQTNLLRVNKSKENGIINLETINIHDDYSIESIYWEVFEVLTQENSFLSRYIVQLIHKFLDKSISKYSLLEQLQLLKSHSFDKVQKDAIDQSIIYATNLES
ncbi:MAG: AAA family ATPase [Malacoplasma sp.]